MVADAFVFRSHTITHKKIEMDVKLPRVYSKKLITGNTIRDYKHILKIRGSRIFIHWTDSPEKNTFIFGAETLRK
jgi:hypothetical protein